jgi:hypothetical protein
MDIMTDQIPQNRLLYASFQLNTSQSVKFITDRRAVVGVLSSAEITFSNSCLKGIVSLYCRSLSYFELSVIEPRQVCATWMGFASNSHYDHMKREHSGYFEWGILRFSVKLQFLNVRPLEQNMMWEHI